MQKPRKAVFLDRDGTLIRDTGYLSDPAQIEFLPGVIEGLRQIQTAGYLLILITNQSGVARGYFSISQVRQVHATLQKQLSACGIDLAAIYFCPHHPAGIVPKYAVSCNCRKPKTGLFLQAVQEYQLDLRQCFAIGDRVRDCSICFESPCRGCLIGSAESDARLHQFPDFASCAAFIRKGAEGI